MLQHRRHRHKLSDSLFDRNQRLGKRHTSPLRPVAFAKTAARGVLSDVKEAWVGHTSVEALLDRELSLLGNDAEPRCDCREQAIPLGFNKGCSWTYWEAQSDSLIFLLSPENRAPALLEMF